MRVFLVVLALCLAAASAEKESYVNKEARFAKNRNNLNKSALKCTALAPFVVSRFFVFCFFLLLVSVVGPGWRRSGRMHPSELLSPSWSKKCIFLLRA
jgi:hypothetical protein